ncbi:MAG: hypothetical protein OXH16_08785 [Gemmatimonadetes bacterium]|nr:hypothetical protein [Gemmatimonadota bacterium]
MDREIVEKKVETLEKRVRWQMRAIIGLIIVVLFNTSPAFTSKWFHRLLPPKLTSVNVASDTGFRNIESHREEILAQRIQAPELGPGRDKTEFINNILSHQNGTPRLGKQAQARVQQILSDTLRVQTLQTRTLQIVNAAGGVVAIIGSDNVGNGILLVGNAASAAVAAISVDQAGNGDISLIENNASIAGMGVDQAGNGVVAASNASGSSFTLLSADDSGNAGLIVSGSAESGAGAVILGLDETGNGLVSTVSSSGSLALLGADNSGNAGLVVGTASESGTGVVILGVDDVGNGSVSAVSASGSIVGLGVDAAGDAAVLVTNKEGVLTSILGVDENGHGIMGVLNASGRPIAAMAADEAGNGILGIEDGKFYAHVDTLGNGVAETRGQNEILRWSSEIAPTGGGGGTPSGLIGDLDQDGDVDFNDFLIFTTNFGKTSG